jgi:large subunit ribosomal protein L21
VFVLVPLLGLVALVVWWWLRWRGEEDGSTSEARIVIRLAGEAGRAQGEDAAPAQDDSAIREKPDDLAEIEGIGPRIRQVLNEAGVVTFSALAAMSEAELKSVLFAAGVRLAFPETWAEQAALAAGGDWDGLRALQATLVRGRRV